MNHDQIDQQIISLLRIPVSHRTQSQIAGAINQIAAEAQLDMTPLGPTQQEQIKLAAIVQFLAKEMGTSRYTVSLDIHDSEFSQAESLFASIKVSDEESLCGSGTTAEEVLRSLRRPHWEKAAV